MPATTRTPEETAQRLREVNASLNTAEADSLKLSEERATLMRSLQEAGWSGVKIAKEVGLTRQRVHSLLKP